MDLGVLERGEASKTVVKQGVIIGRWWVRLMLLVPLKLRQPEERVFQFSQQHLRGLWNWAKRRLKLKDVGPLYSLRHTEPAASVEERRRTLEEVRRMGRWRTLTSVGRYSKTHRLVRQRSQLPPEVRERREELLRNPGLLVEAVLQATPRAKRGACCKRRQKGAKKPMEQASQGQTLRG